MLSTCRLQFLRSVREINCRFVATVPKVASETSSTAAQNMASHSGKMDVTQRVINDHNVCFKMKLYNDTGVFFIIKRTPNIFLNPLLISVSLSLREPNWRLLFELVFGCRTLKPLTKRSNVFPITRRKSGLTSSCGPSLVILPEKKWSYIRCLRRPDRKGKLWRKSLVMVS